MESGDPAQMIKRFWETQIHSARVHLYTGFRCHLEDEILMLFRWECKAGSDRVNTMLNTYNIIEFCFDFSCLIL